MGEKKSIPLWVNFENLPDSYWTSDGLSFLSSAIGAPLCADDRTLNLEILPFAKICVDYKIRDDLPTKLEVEVLDPVSDEKHIEVVSVSYPQRPLVCTGCKTLGHLVGACPKISRVWVLKDKKKSGVTEEKLGNVNMDARMDVDSNCEHNVADNSHMPAQVVVETYCNDNSGGDLVDKAVGGASTVANEGARVGTSTFISEKDVMMQAAVMECVHKDENAEWQTVQSKKY